MFGTLGGPELLLILIVALIVFGPRKLPEIGKNMGRMLGEFRKASNDFQRTIEEEVEAVNRLQRESLEAPAPTPPSATPPAPSDESPSPTVEPEQVTESRESAAPKENI
jgi:TatA/E family protein of Tat protein translocase